MKMENVEKISLENNFNRRLTNIINLWFLQHWDTKLCKNHPYSLVLDVSGKIGLRNPLWSKIPFTFI